jgi:hypothetical protein
VVADRDAALCVTCERVDWPCGCGGFIATGNTFLGTVVPKKFSDRDFFFFEFPIGTHTRLHARTWHTSKSGEKMSMNFRGAEGLCYPLIMESGSSLETYEKKRRTRFLLAS